MAANLLKQFIDKLIVFPLWVKQIIYLRLHDDLKQYLSEDFLQKDLKDLMYLYVPTLTFMGKGELAERAAGFDASIYSFMEAVDQGFNLIEIAMNNFWTLEEIAKYFVLCEEQNYIKSPESIQIATMLGFMSGKFRTGEYFKRIGRINVDQLQDVIMKQKEAADAGTPVMMAELMISLGYLTERETKSLLVIKEEAKKRFILDPSIIPDGKEASKPSYSEDDYKRVIVRLKEQNNHLIEQQKKIVAFLKKQQQSK